MFSRHTGPVDPALQTCSARYGVEHNVVGLVSALVIAQLLAQQLGNLPCRQE